MIPDVFGEHFAIELLENDPKWKKYLAAYEVYGKAEGLQDAIVAVVEGRFSSLKLLAQELIKEVTEPAVLDLLLKQISTAPDEKFALQVLISLISC